LLPKNISDFDITGILPEDEDFYVNAKHSQVVKNGDIVAAEILNEDNNIVLKRIFRRGNKIILQPESTDLKYKVREFSGMNVGFFVCGIAVAVLKPV
jgi:SOS-response transcriptional repressor LexA